MDWVESVAVNVALAAAICVGGFMAASALKRLIVHQGRRYERLDETLFVFTGGMAQYAVIAATLVAVLARFGVETTSIVAVIGAAGLAIGLALQGALSNVAAGVMLMLFRPFKIGHFIEAGGQSGTVQQISLFSTELATLDNVQVILPNSAIFADAIVNFSHYDTRRIELIFGVGYGANLADAEAAILAVVTADERAHKDPAPFLKVSSLNASSVDFTLRVWCDRADFLPLKCDLTRQVKEALDAAGVDIPFPTRTILNG